MATLLGCESPCTGGKRRDCSSNIVAKFTASKITGQGFSRGTQVRENGGYFDRKDIRMLSDRDLGLALGVQPGIEDVVPQPWLEMWLPPSAVA